MYVTLQAYTNVACTDPYRPELDLWPGRLFEVWWYRKYLTKLDTQLRVSSHALVLN